MSKVLLDKSYCSEELCDVERDVYEAFDGDFTPDVADIPVDEHNFHTGKFHVKITWTPDE